MLVNQQFDERIRQCAALGQSNRHGLQGGHVSTSSMFEVKWSDKAVGREHAHAAWLGTEQRVDCGAVSG